VGRPGSQNLDRRGPKLDLEGSVKRTRRTWGPSGSPSLIRDDGQFQARWRRSVAGYPEFPRPRGSSWGSSTSANSGTAPRRGCPRFKEFLEVTAEIGATQSRWRDGHRLRRAERAIPVRRQEWIPDSRCSCRSIVTAGWRGVMPGGQRILHRSMSSESTRNSWIVERESPNE
jgi:hypothetical protein